MSSRWLVDVQISHDDGSVTRARRSPKLQTRVAAERLEREMIAELEQNIGSGLAKAPTPTEVIVPTFAAFAVTFTEKYVAVHNKYSERMNKERIFRNHLCPAFGDLMLDEVTARCIDAYVAQKRAQLTAKTINNHLAVLTRMLKIACEWELLFTTPKIRFLRTMKPDISFLTSTEVVALQRTVAGSPIAPMVTLALNTGLRIGEILAIQWPAVHLERKLLRVMHTLNDDGSLGSPKSGRPRDLPLNLAAAEALAAMQPTQSGFVFTRGCGEPLTRMMAYRPLVVALRQAGLDGRGSGSQRRLGWHMLRHTFASQLVMKGVPMRAVQELLGHANMEMTLRYAHLAPAFTRSAVDSLLDQSLIEPS